MGNAFKQAVVSSKPKFYPHPYQMDGIKHVLQHPFCGLLYPPGLGKTATVLSAYKIMKNKGAVNKMLVVAPLRVCHMVWPLEVSGWSDFEDYSVGILHGAKKDEVLFEEHDIYVINPDGLQWLSKHIKKLVKGEGWMLVVDESSNFKRHSSQRFRTLKKMIDLFERRIILTGTPAPNGLQNLWSQLFIVDGGRRLGKFVTEFRNRFFYPSGYKGYEYKLQDNAEEKIYRAIDDVIVHKSQDELELPERIYNYINIELPSYANKVYDTMKKELVAQLDSGDLAVAVNAAVAVNKLKQISNGNIYDENKEAQHIHNGKVDVVESLVNELDGRPLLVIYEYKHDLEQLLKVFPDTPVLGGGVSAAKVESAISAWNRGELPLMFLHPACLHPSTEVLTEYRGWVKITDVQKSDRVHDGIEFVTHNGCMYSGYKEVVDCFGILMTPEHKILVGDVWREAKDVRNSESARKKALYTNWEAYEIGYSGLHDLQVGDHYASAKCCKEQSKGAEAVCIMYKRDLSLYDRYTILGKMAWNNHKIKRFIGQKLCWARDRGMQAVGEVFELLRRYVPHIQTWADHRTGGREQRVLKRKLYLGNEYGATSEQKEQQNIGVQGRTPSFGGTLQSGGHWEREVNTIPEQVRYSGNCSSRGHEVEIQEEPEKSEVYDLVDCGPRNRFLIRNKEGEVYISHNSAGHGINLQKGNCHDVCWFSLTFDLELYEQANARVHRQGVKNSVTIHHIVANGTIDLRIANVLKKKANVQNDLLNNLLLKELRT